MAGVRRVARETLDLLDWKRRVFALYAEIRGRGDPPAAWRRWREGRDGLFGEHPQSPVPREARRTFGGLTYFDYEPAFRTTAEVTEAEPEHLIIAGSAGENFGATRFATATFRLRAEELALGLYWLDGYAGGLFLSFRDGTSGNQTYGACRYLLDTVKGADLGTEDDRMVLDFNFAYNPSCAYDPTWACPLAPPDNRLAIGIEAGERLAQ